MKLLMFIVCVITVAAILVLLILRAGRESLPLIQKLRAAGIRPGEAEHLLSREVCWSRQDTLMTAREQRFFRRLLRETDGTRWYLCPQVRVADIVQLSPRIRPRTRAWWQLFRMTSQWHCDVVIVDRQTFSIVAAVELDDASHAKPQRQRRDILLNEVLRQAGIPLFRSHDSRALPVRVKAFLRDYQEEASENNVHNMRPAGISAGADASAG